jgi:spermidine synthase
MSSLDFRRDDAGGTVTGTGERGRSTWLLPALALLFFGSGISALIYQVLWLRLMGLVFGVTTYAASTVWAAFMGGLAVGSLVAGRVGDRTRRPLVWFGACELLVGATAVATPAALAALQQFYARLYPALPQSILLLTIVRFVLGAALLIVPTSLMGATLPLVIRSSAFRGSRLAERIALLYGANTAGAIVGALVAGLRLIPGAGLHRTFLVAAAVNLVVGVAAIAMGMRVTLAADRPLAQQEDDAGARTGPVVSSLARGLDERRLRLVLIVFAISGFTSLALEVVWFRVLMLFLRPTVYGFALMLAAVLGGIAAGSWIVTPLVRRRAAWFDVLAVIECAIGVVALLSFEALPRMGPIANLLRPSLSLVMNEWLVYQAVGSMLTIFPTALLMGVAFPIGLALWTGSAEGVGGRIAQRVGTFYSMNVAGSILGSIAAGFVLLPQLGSRGSLAVLAGLSVASGLALVAASRRRATVRVAVAVAAGAAFATAWFVSLDPFGEFLRQRHPGEALLWREEGVEATVAVHQSRSGEISLSLNGNHQASTGRSMVYGHRSIGHLPMLLHPDARRALVVGLGGGATAGAVSVHSGVDVDVVELAGAVVRGARYLRSVNYDVLSRPNVHLRVDDGRNFMLVTHDTYDVITADVIHPIYAGSGNLYSADYFRLMRRVLRPGGIVVQWVAGTDAEYKTIARTFLSVFPDATAWADGTLLVGSTEPLTLKRADFERKLRAPGRAEGARDFGATTFEQLLAAYRAGPAELRAFVGDGPILTDDRPLVEYFLSLPRDRDVDLSALAHADAARLVVDDQ